MSAYQSIRGTFVIRGYAPDGASIRFAPDDARAFDTFSRTRLLRVGRDGTLQVRLAGIDAPELHFDEAEQPLGRKARDHLLATLGFSDVVYDDVFVTDCTPHVVRGAILTRDIDMQGRPLGYWLAGEDGVGCGGPTLKRAVLARTVNAAMLRAGVAYALAYDTDPALHRAVFRQLAHAAKKKGLGVWAEDVTMAGLTLHGRGSVGLHGALVYPKLFRRCVQYLDDRLAGTRDGLRRWLVRHGREDDVVILPSHRLARLSDVVVERGRRVAMRVDPTELTFVAR